MKVGFIGLGNMGAAIAGNILKAGHQLTVWNRSQAPVAELVGKGAVAAKAPEDTLQGDAVFSMLANDAALGEIGLTGPLLEHAAPGLVHVNLATISIELARQMTEAHAACGVDYVAAPVFGRPDAAAAAKLIVIAAGAGKDIARVRRSLKQSGSVWPSSERPRNRRICSRSPAISCWPWPSRPWAKLLPWCARAESTLQSLSRS